MQKIIVALLFSISFAPLIAQSYFSVNSGFGVSKKDKLVQNNFDYTLPLNFEYYTKLKFLFSIGAEYINSKRTITVYLQDIDGTYTPYTDEQTIQKTKFIFGFGYNILKANLPIQLSPFISYNLERFFAYTPVYYYNNRGLPTSDIRSKNFYLAQILRLGVDLRFITNTHFVLSGNLFLEDSFTKSDYTDLYYKNIGAQLKVGYIFNRK